VVATGVEINHARQGSAPPQADVSGPAPAMKAPRANLAVADKSADLHEARMAELAQWRYQRGACPQAGGRLLVGYFLIRGYSDSIAARKINPWPSRALPPGRHPRPKDSIFTRGLVEVRPPESQSLASARECWTRQQNEIICSVVVTGSRKFEYQHKFLHQSQYSSWTELKSDEFSFVFLRRLRFGDGWRPIQAR
jgi:hypothetical protein